MDNSNEQAERPIRARDLGLMFDGTPGANNAITDVDGVLVGHCTLNHGDGQHAVRTGVTAVLPRGRESLTPAFAAWNTINAAGEMTGTTWLEERGYLNGPVVITNTHSVGVARDAVVEWMVGAGWPGRWHAPVAAETCDELLNDINGFHVRRAHVLEALAAAHSGPVDEGNVGGGTGMVCYKFKGGIGTASRLIETPAGDFTVGVLVQTNYGSRRHLRVGNIPLGKELADKYLPCVETDALPADDAPERSDLLNGDEQGDGSIIVVVATDAPVLPHQLKRLAKRPALGLGRLGAVAEGGSGDIFIAFSTANDGLTAEQKGGAIAVRMYPNDALNPLFEGAVEATEEAIVNALVAARTMVGRNGHKVFGLPHDEVRRLVKKYSPS